MSNRLTTMALSLWAAATFSIAQAETLRVGTQEEFDNLVPRIEAAVSGGAQVVDVQLEEGTLLFRDRQLALKNKNWGDVALIIRGNGTLIEPAEPALRDTTPPAQLQATDRLIEVVDEDKKLCRLHLPEGNIQHSTFNVQQTITITQWYKSVSYPVVRISDDWVYFTAKDLSYNNSYKCHSVNLDYGYALRKRGEGVMPRFRLNDAASTARGACRLLSMEGCTFGSLEISGLTVRGNRGTSADYLIYIYKSAADSMVVRDCLFTAIRSGVINAVESRNVRVRDNIFRGCHRYGVFANYCEGTAITGNDFSAMGLATTNSFCVRSSGKDYLVARNRFTDFGYGGIAVGTWWRANKLTDETGVVEHNTLTNTHTPLMDSGAIYLYTQNDDVQVRYNFISDYSGACDNRGIFCDDGASHFQIYGNVITGTPTGYSIDSRATASIATSAQTKTKVVNTGNRIYDNVIDGTIRFESFGTANQCVLGNNVVVTESQSPKVAKSQSSTVNGQRSMVNKLSGLARQGSFLKGTADGVADGKLVVPAATMKRIAALDSAKGLLPYIKTR